MSPQCVGILGLLFVGFFRKERVGRSRPARDNSKLLLSMIIAGRCRFGTAFFCPGFTRQIPSERVVGLGGAACEKAKRKASARRLPFGFLLCSGIGKILAKARVERRILRRLCLRSGPVKKAEPFYDSAFFSF